MAWTPHPNTSTEYRYTAGQEFDCSKFSAAWDRVTNQGGESAVFEEISPPIANPLLNHVVVYSTPKLALDSQVPQLLVNSARWENLTKSVPGFTVSMLRVAELMYKTDWYFTQKLNEELVTQGMGTLNHISEAISRATDKYTPEAQRTDLTAALRKVFKPYVSDETQASTAMKQWYTCLSWMNMRNTVGHPLGSQVNRICDLTLTDFKADVQKNTEYDPVRAAALVMVNLAEAMLADGSAT